MRNAVLLLCLLTIGCADTEGSPLPFDTPPVQPPTPPPPPPSQPPPRPAATTGTVRLIYAIPADREFNQVYADSIQEAIENVQAWYEGELAGATYRLYDTIPEVCHLEEDEAWFLEERGSSIITVWRRLVEGLQDCGPIHGGREAHHWVVYADIDECSDGGGPPFGLGRGWDGLTMMGRWDLQGLTDRQFIQCGWDGPQPLGRWHGGLAHELTHTWNIPHPPGCDEGLPTCDYPALMAGGYTTYPDTYLREDEKAVLLASPTISR